MRTQTYCCNNNLDAYMNMEAREVPGYPPAPRRLTEREQAVLRSVVQSFVETADPVGSRYISKKYMPDLSPASIRNTMSDLEESGYLDHPYTSAGRIPTELGYRTYVDELLDFASLSVGDKRLLTGEVFKEAHNTEDLLQKSSRLLGRLSNLLGIALSPRLSTGILERLEVVPLSSNRAMFIISVRSGLVKTIVLEVDSDLKREELDAVVSVLNERLAGLSLHEIRKTFATRVRDLKADHSGLIKLVIKKAPAIFSELPEGRRFSYSGAKNIVAQPEFREPSEIKNVFELLESEDVVVHLLENRRLVNSSAAGKATVTIGKEHREEKVEKYSIVTASYEMGEMVGTIGVIGPTRMHYGRVIGLVEYMAALLNRPSEAA